MCAIVLQCYAIQHWSISRRSSNLNYFTFVRGLIKCFGEEKVLEGHDACINYSPKKSPLFRIVFTIDSMGVMDSIHILRGKFDKDSIYKYFKENNIIFSHITNYYSLLRRPDFSLDSVYRRVAVTLGYPDLSVYWKEMYKDGLSIFTDSIWFLPLIQFQTNSKNITEVEQINTALFDLSIVYSIGEYESNKLLKNGFITAELKLNESGIPDSLSFTEIGDTTLVPILTDRLFRFWKYNKLKFYPDTSNKYTNTITLKIDSSYIYTDHYE